MSLYHAIKYAVILLHCSDSTHIIFEELLTNSCTFACAWCVCVTYVASLLPSHQQALLWPSHTSQPLKCTRVVANVSFRWTWELPSQGSWRAWDTVGRHHYSVLQWSVYTRLPVVLHCEFEHQADILEQQQSCLLGNSRQMQMRWPYNFFLLGWTEKYNTVRIVSLTIGTWIQSLDYSCRPALLYYSSVAAQSFWHHVLVKSFCWMAHPHPSCSNVIHWTSFNNTSAKGVGWGRVGCDRVEWLHIMEDPDDHFVSGADYYKFWFRLLWDQATCPYYIYKCVYYGSVSKERFNWSICQWVIHIFHMVTQRAFWLRDILRIIANLIFLNFLPAVCLILLIE